MELTADMASGTVERVSDFGSTPAAQVKRWLLELKLADKTEKDWRRDAQKVLDKYRGENKRKNTFNILWSNTETLRPAVYNSLPNPDVRRRYRDKDPLGKIASQVTSRCLEYAIDTTSFDATIKNDILDMLLQGRGVSRVRYLPSFTGQESAESSDQEAQEGSVEELAWEQATIEHVQWDDFRRGPGKTWEEVGWVGFRHRMTRDDLVKLNPDIGEHIELDTADDEDIKKADQAVQDVFKTCEVWEIWCKDDRQVYFVTESYKDEPLKVEDDPLKLLDFFPVPRPLYAIEDSSSLVPVVLYSLYEEQAAELDAITGRISRIVKGLKLRGVYDSTISEISQVMRGDDNDLIPAQNVSALLERGGLDKAIWMLPIQPAAAVLVELYKQREMTKQVIYEITGISDILRGASVASETATAQQIKAKWGSLRIQRMQAEVQRYIRDLFRLMAEVIGEHFNPQTLAAQSLIPIQLVMQAVPVLKSDMLREFHIDVETDSTVAASMESDMQGLQQVLSGIVQFIQGIGPAVQAKAVPVEAVKEIVMAIVRRSKLGNAVEDALDGMQEPQQGGMNPEQIQQAKQQYEQQIQQLQKQLQQAQMQGQQAMQKAQQLEQQSQFDQSKTQAEVQKDFAIAQAKISSESELEKYRIDMDYRKAIEVAQISAGSTLKAAQIQAAEASKQQAESNASI